MGFAVSLARIDERFEESTRNVLLPDRPKTPKVSDRMKKSDWVRAFPGLKIETWGTQQEFRIKRLVIQCLDHRNWEHRPYRMGGPGRRWNLWPPTLESKNDSRMGPPKLLLTLESKTF